MTNFPIDHLTADQLAEVIAVEERNLAELDAEIAFAERIADDIAAHGHRNVAEAIECLGMEVVTA